MAELVAGFEPVERLVSLHETFLGGVLGFIAIAQDQKGGAECTLLIAADQLLEGAGVTALSSGDECFVFQRTTSR